VWAAMRADDGDGDGDHFPPSPRCACATVCAAWASAGAVACGACRAQPALRPPRTLGSLVPVACTCDRLRAAAQTLLGVRPVTAGVPLPPDHPLPPLLVGAPPDGRDL